MQVVNVTVTMPDWKYKILLKKIDALKNGMRLFKINEEFKKSFMDDIYSIETIIRHGGKNE